ncbi:MAG: NAD-dependent epimerase/dehydratase family protein [Fidelibacterota bacterium]
MKLIVTGGNGFIGSEICRQAVGRGTRVVSISRRGAPKRREPWMEDVLWFKADIFDTHAWKGVLEKGDQVVHTVGILLEKRKKNLTYDRMNGESVITVAHAAAEAGISTFAMISAADAPPFIKGYIQAKRKAEEYLKNQPFRSMIFRPGFVYGPGRRGTAFIAALTRFGLRIPLAGKMLGAYTPVHVSLLAAAVLESLEKPEIQGILDINAIRRTAQAVSGREDHT